MATSTNSVRTSGATSPGKGHRQQAEGRGRADGPDRQQAAGAGGWVATSKISRRCNLEQERDRNHAFLHQIIDHIPSQITVKDARDRATFWSIG